MILFRKLSTIFFLSLLISFTFSSCKKTEEVAIANNTSPTDKTISELTKKNYVNKVYISVLGREPDITELNSDLALLNTDNFSVTKRNEFVLKVLNKPGYDFRNFTVAMDETLNGTDTSNMNEFIAIFSSLLSNTSYMSQWPAIAAELHKLILLHNLPAALEGDSIDIIGMHKRCVYNYFYDQINMGTANFVTATFQNFCFRYPTDNELNNCIAMVDGQNSSLFFQTGNSKQDFMDIFFNSDNYFEGQVRELFLRYLFRVPTSEEMSLYTLQYKSNHDYKALQKRILSLDEYVGI